MKLSIVIPAYNESESIGNTIDAPHFNLTIELPLKAIIRGYTYTVIPNSWTGRKHGVSKLKIKEMGSRYFFILMYCFIEKYFSRGDFRKREQITDLPSQSTYVKTP